MDDPKELIAAFDGLTKYTDSVYFIFGGRKMSIKSLRAQLGDTQSEFSERYHIPFRTIQNWETGVNTPPPYVEELLSEKVKADLINRRHYRLPMRESSGRTLPKAGDYLSQQEWLSAVYKELGGHVVFALDSALMYEGSYFGRMNEWVIWLYGPKTLEKYKGVCVIGEEISTCDVEERNGVRFTCFNRTLNDAMANERVLDLQGITEALSRYYYSHEESFQGIHPDPKYAALFDQISADAVEYYCG